MGNGTDGSYGEDSVVDRARQGDREAFRTLTERHAAALFRLAYRMTGNETDAEDMVQDTLLRAWRQIRRFDGRASFATWLHRICANCAIDFLRSRNRWRSDDSDPFRNLPSTAPSPERAADSSQTAAMLEPALATLSDIERTAFILRHYEGLSIEQIAQALGVQAGAARHSIFRAVRKLRMALEPTRSL